MESHVVVEADSLISAMQHHREGDLATASRMYRQIVRVDPQHAEALQLLGVLALQQQAHAEAVHYLRQAVEAAPGDSRFHHQLGTALLELAQPEQAAVSLQRACELDRHNADAPFRLAAAYEQQRIPNKALAGYLQATQLQPAYLPARRGLARMLEMLGRCDEAAAVCLQTLELDATDVETLNQLACLRYRQGKLPEAAALFKQALEADPSHLGSWLNLGSAFVASRQLAEAERCFRQVTQIDKDNTDGWLNLSNILKVQHRVEEAATAFREATRRLPSNPLFDLWPATLCPAVLQDNGEIDHLRERLSNDIGRFLERNICIDLNDIGATASPPPINLQYHGRDDRSLLEAFAGIFRRGFSTEPPRSARNRRPRIGFVVTGGHEAIFQRFLGGVLNNLASADFDLVIVCPETSVGSLRQGLHNSSIGFLPIPYQFPLAVESVRTAGFDVLYHWETGTDVTNYFLPFCRLAPVQCTSFGNSETSGIAAIDFFISSSMHEPALAEEHYTEKLLPLSGLGSCQRRVSLPSLRRNREDFGYSSNQHLYVCAQKPQKIHPDFDHILADILRRDSRGVIVLVEDEYQTAGEMLRRRFRSSIPDVADRVTFESRLEFSDYLCLLAIADVLLDPLHYGGGMTMYDALSLDRPVVTLPGRFARGRYALGFYQKMEMTTLIADSPENYVDIAVRLATESDFRVTVEAEIQERSSVVFDDSSVAAEYEQLFEQLLTQAQAV